jgi:NitT/TauT family transport system substrate-binding protein
LKLPLKQTDKVGLFIKAAANRHSFCRLFLIGFFLIYFIGSTFSSVTVSAAQPQLKKATFIPQWVPQAQFAGYYVALERGMYKDHGIDLKIITGGPAQPSSDLLKDHKADFATLWLSTALPLRDQGIRLINIAQTMQKSALMLVAKKSSGIMQPVDMQGKKIGLWGPIFQIQPKAFFNKFNLDVKIVRQSFSVNLFLRDGVDVASAMWYNEYHTILNSGLNPDELSTFFFHQHGLNFPEDGIYTLEETYRKDPDLCRSFVRASLDGWRYAFAHPEETLDIVMKNLENAYVPATRVHQKWMLERMRDLMLPDDAEIPMGKLLPGDYMRVVDGLKENGLIKNTPDFNDFYRNCYEK